MELKWDQDATQTVVSGLVDRLEIIATQIKDMQEQTSLKWEGVQLQLPAMGNRVQTRKECDSDKEQTMVWVNDNAMQPNELRGMQSEEPSEDARPCIQKLE